MSSRSRGENLPTVFMAAQELARIDGRRPEDFTQAHGEQAKKELQGGHTLASENGSEDMIAAVTDWEEVAGSHGYRVEKRGQDDTENVGIELISEGMEEAVHEQMLEASRMDELEEDEETGKA